MSDRDKQICRMCLDITPSCECEAIDEIKKQILKVLLISIDFDISDDAVACNKCLKRLQDCYDFKSRCSSTYAILINEKICLDSSQICRLCLSLVEVNGLNNTTYHDLKDDVSLKEFIGNCFPEVDLDTVCDVLLCDPCQSSVKGYYEFMENCEKVEREIHDYCRQVESNGTASRVTLENLIKFRDYDVLDEPTVIKKECVDAESIDANFKNKENSIKSEEIHIKDEGLDNGEELKVNHPLVNHDCFGNNGFSIQEPIDQLVYGRSHLCPRCPYFVKRYPVKGRASFYTDNETCKCFLCPLLTTPELPSADDVPSHKGPCRTFGCCECSYETDQKRYLQQHFLVHKSKFETEMFRCEQCGFETKRKTKIITHVETHKDPSVAKKFSCEKCPFRCIDKSSLKRHIGRHRISYDKGTSSSNDKGNPIQQGKCENEETKRYQCKLCGHQVKSPLTLKAHMAKTHKDPSVPIMKCPHCPYETTLKHSLSRHVSCLHSRAEDKPMPKRDFKPLDDQ